MLFSSFIDIPANPTDAGGFNGTVLPSLPSTMNASVTSLSSPGYRPVFDESSINEPFSSYSPGDTIKNTSGWSNWNGTNGVEDFSSYSAGATIDNTAYWNNWDASNIGYEGFASYAEYHSVDNEGPWNNWVAGGFEGFTYTDDDDILAPVAYWSGTARAGCTSTKQTHSGKECVRFRDTSAVAGYNDVAYTFGTANPSTSSGIVKFYVYRDSTIAETTAPYLYTLFHQAASRRIYLRINVRSGAIAVYTWTGATDEMVNTMLVMTDASWNLITVTVLSNLTYKVTLGTTDSSTYTNEANAAWTSGMTSMRFWTQTVNTATYDAHVATIQTSWYTAGPDVSMTFTKEFDTGGLTPMLSWVKPYLPPMSTEPIFTYPTAKAVAAGDWIEIKYRHNVASSTIRPYITFKDTGGANRILFYTTHSSFHTYNNLTYTNIKTGLSIGDIVTIRVTLVSTTTFSITYSINSAAPVTSATYTNYDSTTFTNIVSMQFGCGAATFDWDLFYIKTSWTTDGPDEALTFAESGGKGLFTKRSGGTPTSYPIYTFGTAGSTDGDEVSLMLNIGTVPNGGSGSYRTMNTAATVNLALFTFDNANIKVYDNLTLRTLQTFSAGTNYTIKVVHATTTTFHCYVGSTRYPTAGEYTNFNGGNARVGLVFLGGSDAATVGDWSFDDISTSWTSTAPSYHVVSTFTAATDHGSTAGNFSKTLAETAFSYPIYNFTSAQANAFATVGYLVTPGTISSTDATGLQVSLYGTGSTAVQQTRFTSNGSLQILDDATWRSLRSWMAGVMYNVTIYKVNATKYDVLINATRYTNGGSHYTTAANTTKAVTSTWFDGSTFSTGVLYIDTMWMVDGGIPLVQRPGSCDEDFESYTIDADINGTGWNEWIGDSFTFQAKTYHGSKRAKFTTFNTGGLDLYPAFNVTVAQSEILASVGYVISPSSITISAGTTYFYANLMYLEDWPTFSDPVQSLRLTGVGLTNAGEIQVKDDATWRTLRSWTAGVDYNITINFVSATKYDVLINGTLYSKGMSHYTKTNNTSYGVTSIQFEHDRLGYSTVYLDNLWGMSRHVVMGTFDVFMTARVVDGSTGAAIAGLSYTFTTNGTADASGTTSAATINVTLPFAARDVADWNVVAQFNKTGYTNETRTTLVRVLGWTTSATVVSLVRYNGVAAYLNGGVYYTLPESSSYKYRLRVNFYDTTNGTLATGGTSDVRVTDGVHAYTNTSTTGVLDAYITMTDLTADTNVELTITCHMAGLINASTSITVYVDTVSPTSGMSYNIGYWTGFAHMVNASTLFTISGSDGGSGISYYKYRIGGSGSYLTYTAPFNIANLTDGTYDIYYYVVDNVGWSSTPTYMHVSLDATTPETTVTFTVAFGTDWVNATTSFTLSATDGGSGVVDIWYKVDAGSWVSYSGAFTLASYGNGTHTLYFYSEDGIGNAEVVNSTTVRLDMIAAVTMIVFLPEHGTDWVNGNTTFTLAANDNAGGSGLSSIYYTWNGTWQLYTAAFTLSACPADGAITITYRAIDHVGNVETNNTQLVNLDRTAAVTVLNFVPAYGTDWVNATTSFTLSPDDTPGAGVASTHYTWNGTWQLYTVAFTLGGMANGTYTIEYYSVDNVGNVEMAGSVVVQLDTIAAVTMIVFLPEHGADWVNGNTTFTLTANDNAGGSGIDSILYRFNGTWQLYTVAFTLNASLVDGTITIEYYSVDNVGNVETAGSVVVQLDKLAAVTSLLFSPAVLPNYITNSTSFTLSSSDIPGSGVASIWYRYNVTWHLYTTPFVLVALVNGTYTIEYYSVDNVGNVEMAGSVVVRVDLIAPVVSIIFTPHAGLTTVNVTTSFTLAANDNDGGCGVDYDYYAVNGTIIANYTAPFQIGLFSQGSWLITCYAVDNVGNTGSSSVVVLLVRYNVSIVITSDADWALYASSGNGSAGNPWVLTGYNITASVCVNITNTTEHGVIEDSALFDSGTGFYIGSASNITITNCTFDNCTLDIVLSAVTSVDFQECYFPEAISFVAGGGSSGITFDRNFYQDYFNRYPYDVTLNTTTDILESNYTIVTGIVDDNPRYHAPWYDTPRSIYIKYFTSLDHQGLPFYQVDTWIDGEAVATDNSIVNVFMFRLTTSYVGINVNITDQMVNYNYSRNLRIDLKMAPTMWINNYTFPIEVDVYAYGMLWTAFTIAPQQAFGPLRMAMGTYTYEVRYLNSTLLYNQSSVVTDTTASWSILLWSDVGVSGEIDDSYVPTDLDRLVYIFAPALLTIAIGVIVVAAKRRSAKVLQRGKDREPAKRTRRETSVTYVKG